MTIYSQRAMKCTPAQRTGSGGAHYTVSGFEPLFRSKNIPTLGYEDQTKNPGSEY